MTDNGFKAGNLNYEVETGVTPERLVERLAGEWQDGYVAFANGEKRLGDLKKAGIALDTGLLSGRINKRLDDRIEGYVTELNLWRSDGAIFEEIAVEREENSYYLQRFRLDTAAAESNCLYREAATRSARGILNGNLPSIEVVCPEKRFNIYITRGA